MNPRPARASVTTLVQIMEIVHANSSGNVHGGTIMRLVDSCAGVAAQRHCRGRVVTATMDEMSFLAPVYIGEVLRLQATVNEAFGTSMEVGVHVDVEGDLGQPARHVSSAYLVFVALDGDGRPTRVPSILAETEAERRRQEQARIRREQRLLRKQALQRHVDDVPSAPKES